MNGSETRPVAKSMARAILVWCWWLIVLAWRLAKLAISGFGVICLLVIYAGRTAGPSPDSGASILAALLIGGISVAGVLIAAALATGSLGRPAPPPISAETRADVGIVGAYVVERARGLGVRVRARLKRSR